MRLLLCAAVIAATASCSDEATCIEVDVDCERLYEPTFDNVFSETLEAKCGISGPCHNATSAKAGLVYEDPDESYDLLLESRVEPGNPGCSLLIRRIESTNTGFRMPPGGMLSEQERCSIRQWIASGAER